MIKAVTLIFIMAITLSFVACNKKDQTEKSISQTEKPSDADFTAFKVYHHMVYMVTTAKQAGGTNKLFHTKELPTEGTRRNLVKKQNILMGFK